MPLPCALAQRRGRGAFLRSAEKPLPGGRQPEKANELACAELELNAKLKLLDELKLKLELLALELLLELELLLHDGGGGHGLGVQDGVCGV